MNKINANVSEAYRYFVWDRRMVYRLKSDTSLPEIFDYRTETWIESPSFHSTILGLSSEGDDSDEIDRDIITILAQGGVPVEFDCTKPHDWIHSFFIEMIVHRGKNILEDRFPSPIYIDANLLGAATKAIEQFR
jgi:hypothetical protein